MNISKKIVATIVGLSMMVMAAPVSGATVAELQAQIAALLAQINALQAQLSGLQGAPAGGACSFTRNLSVGVRGDDVKCLQNYLIGAGQSIPAGATGYFGSQTQAAVASWQSANGVSPAAGYFGPISRSKYSSLVVATPTPTPTPTPSGKEGTLSATAGTTPADAGTIYAGNQKVSVASLKVKALGSDINLSRIDVNFTTRPWLNIAKITVSDGSTDVMTFDVTQANTIEVTVGSSYTVRLTGLNITIPDGVEKTLTIKVDPMLVAGDSTETITYQILANGLRGKDGVGIEQYAPSTALTARTFTVSTQTGALNLSLNANTPKQRAVIGSSSVITENVELLRFDLKATINDVIVSQINTGTLLDEKDILQTLKLYDGSTLLAATSVTSGQAHVFKPLDLRITKDTIKTLTIKADTEIATEARINGSSSVSVATGGVTSSDAGTFSSLTTSGSTATGKKVYLYTIAPKLTLVSTSIATNRAGRTDGSNTVSADAKIRFTVEAMGGDVYIASTTPSNTTTTASVAGIHRTETRSFTTEAETAGNWVVRNGQTKWFEITSFITNGSPTASFLYMYLASTTWGTSTATDTLARNFQWDWADIQDEFKTASVFLQAQN